tara:strand:+ start:720 stop:1463 length:744 start_codon:yes stop_codon:yes gene_type:complete
MKKLNETQLKENWDKLINLVSEIFSGDRKDKLLKMYKHFEERMMFTPGSGTAHFHNCFIGGYVEHVLHITKIARKLFVDYKELGAHIDYTEEEVIFAALHHDLGKVGDLENDYYVPNDSKWHIENQGKYYKRGKDLNFMTVTDRAIYLLNHFGISMSENEYIALRLTDGMYEEANKTYLMQYLDENKVKSNLPILLHQADMLASRIEYENWKYQDETISKPEPVKIVNKQEQKKVDGMKQAFDELFN